MSADGDIAGFDAVLATPLPGGWRVGVKMANGQLLRVEFLPAATALLSPRAGASDAARQVAHYFSTQGGCSFSIPINGFGTPFQHRVWNALREIPAGKTLTYGALAEQLGSSARAVAAACRANRLPLVVPCHRVVAARGPGGFMGAVSGDALDVKLWLLQHESG